jgi:hypothetical protein
MPSLGCLVIPRVIAAILVQAATPSSYFLAEIADSRITTREILGGLHHEYELERTAA